MNPRVLISAGARRRECLQRSARFDTSLIAIACSGDHIDILGSTALNEAVVKIGVSPALVCLGSLLIRRL